jgi:hypothetical protein
MRRRFRLDSLLLGEIRRQFLYSFQPFKRPTLQKVGQGLQAEDFQDFIGQLTGVGQGDSQETVLQQEKLKCQHGIS